MTSEQERLAAVRECMQEALALDHQAAAGIDESTGAADMAAWDSQGHIKLVIALEKRFGVEFGDDDIVELVSVKDILRILAARA